MRTTTLATPSRLTLGWFSVQLLVNSEIFKLDRRRHLRLFCDVISDDIAPWDPRVNTICLAPRWCSLQTTFLAPSISSANMFVKLSPSSLLTINESAFKYIDLGRLSSFGDGLNRVFLPNSLLYCNAASAILRGMPLSQITTWQDLIKSSAALMSSTDRCLLAPARLINAGSPELLTATREKIDCK